MKINTCLILFMTAMALFSIPNALATNSACGIITPMQCPPHNNPNLKDSALVGDCALGTQIDTSQCQMAAVYCKEPVKSNIDPTKSPVQPCLLAYPKDATGDFFKGYVCSSGSTVKNTNWIPLGNNVWICKEAN